MALNANPAAAQENGVRYASARGTGQGTWSPVGDVEAQFSAITNCDASQSTRPFIVRWVAGGTTYTFRTTSIESSTCYALFDTITMHTNYNSGEGKGTVNGAPASFSWDFEDRHIQWWPFPPEPDLVRIDVSLDTGEHLNLRANLGWVYDDETGDFQQQGSLNGAPGGVWASGERHGQYWPSPPWEQWAGSAEARGTDPAADWLPAGTIDEEQPVEAKFWAETPYCPTNETKGKFIVRWVVDGTAYRFKTTDLEASSCSNYFTGFRGDYNSSISGSGQGRVHGSPAYLGWDFVQWHEHTGEWYQWGIQVIVESGSLWIDACPPWAGPYGFCTAEYGTEYHFLDGTPGGAWVNISGQPRPYP